MVRKVHLDREGRELSLLFDTSRTIERFADLRDVLDPLLTKLDLDLGMKRATLTLLNRDDQEVFIEAAHDLAGRAVERTRYRLGEGITGQVVASGCAAVVPRIADEPDFLHRAWPVDENLEEDFGFVCVPVRSAGETLGALSCHRASASAEDLQRDLRLLTILAAMIAEPVKRHRTAREQRRRLQDESELRPRFRPANIIGKSKAMQAVYDLIAQVSRSEATVLLEGESGVGKERVAHAIHHNSLRASRPFVRSFAPSRARSSRPCPGQEFPSKPSSSSRPASP